MTNRQNYDSRNRRSDIFEDLESMAVVLLTIAGGLAGFYQLCTIEHPKSSPTQAEIRASVQNPSYANNFFHQARNPVN